MPIPCTLIQTRNYQFPAILSARCVTDDLKGVQNAVDLVKAAVAALGGQGGGGRPDMAQGGGPDGGKAADALAAVRGAIVAEKAAA